MIGYRTRFRENDNLPLCSPAVKKKPPFFNARALITREIMGSRDMQCNTKDDLKLNCSYYVIICRRILYYQAL